MKSFPRLTLAVGTLVAGAVGGMTLSAHLHGQAPAGVAANQPLPAVMPKEFASYRDVVKRIVPAVVSIEARAAVKPGSRARALSNSFLASSRLPKTKSQQAAFWKADPHRTAVYNQFMNGTTPFEFTKNYKFTIVNNENVWAKAMSRVINDKVSVEQAVTEMIARIKQIAGTGA